MIISQVSVTVMNSEKEESILRMRALLNLQMTHNSQSFQTMRCEPSGQNRKRSQINVALVYLPVSALSSDRT